MTKHEALARANFLEGYNCAQAVLLAFAEDAGLEKNTALRLASSFGGGVGGMREMCGALSGACMAAGLLFGYDSPDAKEEKAAHYTDTVRFSAGAFQDALGVKLSGSPGSWFRDVTYTDGGGVDTIVIGGTSYKGTDLRSALGLRSTAFSISTTEDTVIITTRGYGHRVGMSQYGADAMAVTGSTCPEILVHYYPGTTLTKLG